MNPKRLRYAAVPLLVVSAAAADFTLTTFTKQPLEKFYWSEGAALVEPDGRTLYTQDAQGYTDYPALAAG